jgi:putative proteasome-type protease
MTYCVGILLDAGMVFLADSRTNAGVDQISTFRKVTVFEKQNDRVMVLMSAGNLAISQALVNVLRERTQEDGESLFSAPNMFEAAQHVGAALRGIYHRDAEALKEHNIEFNASLILGGQIGAAAPRLFCIYAAGNFIEATADTPYFQIGESKYGKPVIDRVVTPETPLDEAAKCALVSMDSTLKSNLSVGLPLDLLVYEGDSLHTEKVVHIDENNAYFRMIRTTWGRRLREVFDSIPAPSWHGEESEYPLTTPDPAQSKSVAPSAGMLPTLAPVRAPDA